MSSWRIRAGVVACVALSACASPALPEAMVPEAVTVENTHPHSVLIAVEGGKETNPMWASRVSNEAFIEALTTCVENTGLFTTVVRDVAGGDYLLEVAIMDLDQPAAGFDMTVTMTTSWKLTELSGGQVVFQEFLDTAHTATVGDAFAGMKRLRLANEGAARANIRDGVARLSKLQLGTGVEP